LQRRAIAAVHSTAEVLVDSDHAFARAAFGVGEARRRPAARTLAVNRAALVNAEEPVTQLPPEEPLLRRHVVASALTLQRGGSGGSLGGWGALG
jgi:hypothetical protein